jgi:hypothetical protein
MISGRTARYAKASPASTSLRAAPPSRVFVFDRDGPFETSGVQDVDDAGTDLGWHAVQASGTFVIIFIGFCD